MSRVVRRAYASIVAWREATNTKQEDLARMVGISPTHLANIERGTRGCSAGVLMKLSQRTNVAPELIVALKQTRNVA